VIATAMQLSWKEIGEAAAQLGRGKSQTDDNTPESHFKNVTH
jgi:hypothetical protein